MMQNLLIGGLLLAAFGWGLPAGGLELVKDGRPQGAIILSPRASPSEQLAADELAAYLKKMSGAAVPVTTQAAPAGIVIGTLLGTVITQGR